MRLIVLALVIAAAALVLSLLPTPAASFQGTLEEYQLESVQSVQETQPSESVDWYNTQYTSDCQGLAAQPFTVNVHNGEGNGPPDNRYYNGYVVEVEAVATGDLTGDGRPEAAVLLYCSPQPSNFYLQEVQVFTDGTDGPQVLGELPELSPLPEGLDLPPVFDSEHFFIDSGQLVTGAKYYSATDSHASGPSIYRVRTWQWDGNQFVTRSEQSSSEESQQTSDRGNLAEGTGRGTSNQTKPPPDVTQHKVSDPPVGLKLPPTSNQGLFVELQRRLMAFKSQAMDILGRIVFWRQNKEEQNSHRNGLGEMWAGYQGYGPPTNPTTYLDVKGRWRIPEVTCSANETSYLYLWVGIGGATEPKRTIQQIGTASMCLEGKPIYGVFAESFPEPAILTSYPGEFKPGDEVESEVELVDPDRRVFVFSITDLTTGKSIETPPETVPDAEVNSAECIAEAPRGQMPKLKSDTIKFTNCTANGQPISKSPIVEKTRLVSIPWLMTRLDPSNLQSDGTAFTITQKRQ